MHTKALVHELKLSEAETQKTYTISSASSRSVHNHTYTIDPPSLENQINEEKSAVKNHINATEDEISPPTSCEVRAAAGDGIGAPAANIGQTSLMDHIMDEACALAELPMQETLSAIEEQDEDNSGVLDQKTPEFPKTSEDSSSPDSSLGTGTGFITAPDDHQDTETSPSVSTSHNDTVSVEYSKTESQRSAQRTVRVSKNKASELPMQMALMMGCKTSLIPRPKSHSARIQTHYKRVKEICTQSLYKETNETAMLARTETHMADSQTSPQLFRSKRVEC